MPPAVEVVQLALQPPRKLIGKPKNLLSLPCAIGRALGAKHGQPKPIRNVKIKTLTAPWQVKPYIEGD